MEEECQEICIPVCGHRAVLERYYPAGPAAEFSILALHGFTGSGADFSALREVMSGLPVEWLCLDFMGHGRSDAPANVDPYRLTAALALIDRARGMASRSTKVILLGYSMGGRLALHYLKWARPLPTVLIGASPGIEDPRERAMRQQQDAGRIEAACGDIRAFCESWERQELIRPQTVLPEPLRIRIAKRRRQNTLQGLTNSFAGCGTGALPALWSSLGNLPELTCLYGEQDHKFAEIAARMEHAGPRITAQAIHGAGHAPHLENPETVATLLKNYLKIS